MLPPSNITAPPAPASTTVSNVFGTNTPSQNLPEPPRIASQEQLPPPAQNRVDSDQQPPPTVASRGLQGHHLPVNDGHNGLTDAHGHIPPHIQAAMNSHFAALSQQLRQQLVMGTMAPPTMPARPIQSNHLHQISTSAQPSFQQVITQQQQARAAAGRQGVAGVPITDPSHAQAQTPDQATSTLPETSSGNINLLAPEAQEPSSNSWRITVNESTITIPTAHAGYGSTAGANTIPLAPQGAVSDLASAVAFSMSGHPGAATQSNPTALDFQASGVETSGRAQVQHNETVQQGILNLERMLAGGSVPAQSQINAVRSQVREMGRHRNVFSEGLERVLNTRLSNISTRASQMGRNSAGHAIASDSRARVATSMLDSATPMVYLLSSPSGPHALLVSPSGLYGTIPRIIPFPIGSAPLNTNFQQQHWNHAQAINRLGDFRGQQPAMHNPPQPARPAQPMLQDRVQAPDLARILLPFGGHLWLFVRLFGFVYFFTPGGGWRRAAVFAASALVVLLFQSGFFRPVYQAVLEPFRRHVEGLVPLADNGRRDVGGVQGAVANDEARVAAGRIPDVRQAAERLLREREQRDFGAVRQYLRNFERAVAIFFASLVPGIGERHIAARDTAETVRLVEQLEREAAGVGRDEVAEEPGVEQPNRGETPTNAAPEDRNEDDHRVMHNQPPVVEI